MLETIFSIVIMILVYCIIYLYRSNIKVRVKLKETEIHLVSSEAKSVVLQCLWVSSLHNLKYHDELLDCIKKTSPRLWAFYYSKVLDKQTKDMMSEFLKAHGKMVEGYD